MERAWVLGTPNWRRAAHPRTPLDCCINEKGTFLVFIHQGFGIYVTNAIVTLNCKSNHESHLSVSKLEPLLGLGLPDMCSPTEPSVPCHLWMLLLRASETGSLGDLAHSLGSQNKGITRVRWNSSVNRSQQALIKHPLYTIFFSRYQGTETCFLPPYRGANRRPINKYIHTSIF